MPLTEFTRIINLNGVFTMISLPKTIGKVMTMSALAASTFFTSCEKNEPLLEPRYEEPVKPAEPQAMTKDYAIAELFISNAGDVDSLHLLKDSKPVVRLHKADNGDTKLEKIGGAMVSENPRGNFQENMAIIGFDKQNGDFKISNSDYIISASVDANTTQPRLILNNVSITQDDAAAKANAIITKAATTKFKLAQ